MFPASATKVRWLLYRIYDNNWCIHTTVSLELNVVRLTRKIHFKNTKMKVISYCITACVIPGLLCLSTVLAYNIKQITSIFENETAFNFILIKFGLS